MKKGAKITPQNATEVISRYLYGDVFPFVLDLEKSTGNHLYDSRSGRYLLDCFSFIASNPLGFNHPKMNDRKFERKLLRTAKVKPSNSDIYCVELAEFVEAFTRLALPPEFKHLFFVEGGAVAVENGLKTAFDWKVRKNFLKGETDECGSLVIHFEEAFHGRSGYALSLTNTADPRKTKYFPKLPWPRFPNPKIRFPLAGENLESVAATETRCLEMVRRELVDRAEDVAAIIVETIQGEGGDNHFRAEFFKGLRALADEYDVLLIFDEVQCGAGITGRMWAFEHFGVTPDIFAFGKKTQVCGIAVTSRIDDVPNNVFSEPSRINSTWGGSLVDMVRAQRYFEIIAEERLVENAARVGRELLSALEGLQAEYPQLISNARGRGLMCAFDLPNEEKRSAFLARVREGGAILLSSGRASVRLRPSLTFSTDEVAELAPILSAAARELA